MIDGDQTEKKRRSDLSRYACRFFSVPTFNGLRSALEDIEKRSQALLGKGAAVRFVDKGRDSGEVAKLVERLREAIARYQVNVNCFVASSAAHRRADITTASDL